MTAEIEHIFHLVQSINYHIQVLIKETGSIFTYSIAHIKRQTFLNIAVFKSKKKQILLKRKKTQKY